MVFMRDNIDELIDFRIQQAYETIPEVEFEKEEVLQKLEDMKKFINVVRSLI